MANYLRDAIRYQQEMEEANRPVTVNSLMAAKFANQRANVTQPTSVMDERYPAWKKTQDQADQFLIGADLATAPFGLPKGAVTAGAKYAGRTLADLTEGHMRNVGMMPNATVYHGSPHRFDKFDASKIGTGEGAQAYGHGLYFAEKPEIARAYQNTLSKYGELRLNDGSKVNVPDLPYNSPEQIAGQLWMNKPNLADAKFALGNMDSKYLGAPKEAIVSELEKLHGKGASLSGSFFKVDLPDEQIAKMLDWDKPLSKQSKEVQDALARATSNSSGTGKDVPRWSGVVPANYEARSHLGTTILVDPKTGMAVHPNATHPGGETDALRMAGDKGSVYLDELRVALGGEKNVAEFLRKNGIPGIRYLDGGSRSGGAGTSNFVVFPGNEGLLKILERQ